MPATRRQMIEEIARMLSMPFIRVLEVATFYTMFNLEPVGTYLVQVCTTTPCWLRGSDAVVEACKKHIHPHQKTVSEDGKFSWMRIALPGQQGAGTALSAEERARLRMPESFRRNLAGILEPGATVVITKDSLQTADTGEAVTVIAEDEHSESPAAPAAAGSGQPSPVRSETKRLVVHAVAVRPASVVTSRNVPSPRLSHNRFCPMLPT